MFDILAHLLSSWDAQEINTEHMAADLAKLGERFLNHPVDDLPDLSGNDLFAAIMKEEKAARIIQLYALGLHRVALLDIDGAVTNIVSQSDVIKFLHRNLALLGDFATKTIEELHLASTTDADEIAILPQDQTTIQSFQELAARQMSAAPIVGKDGVMLGTLSISDLKSLRRESVSSLLLPSSQYKDPTQGGIKPDVVCTLTDTLGDVITKLASSNVHRVWVLDDGRRPISCVSITNICFLLSQLLTTPR